MNLIDFSSLFPSQILTLPFKFLSFLLFCQRTITILWLWHMTYWRRYLKICQNIQAKKWKWAWTRQTLLVVLFVSQSLWSPFLFIYHKFHFRPNTFLCLSSVWVFGWLVSQYTAVNWFITHTTCTWHHFAPPANEGGNLGKGVPVSVPGTLVLPMWTYEKHFHFSLSCSRAIQKRKWPFGFALLGLWFS